jgi:hypothetical protein
MGCDIHVYIEYTDKKTLEKEKNGILNSNGVPIKAYWRNFGGNLSLGRNYWLFGILSKGVRSDIDNAFEPKGIPPFDSLSNETRSDYAHYISNENDDDDNYVTMEKAIKWSNSYGVELYYRNPTDDKPTWVSGPDWHSHSWLTTDELEQALAIYHNMCVEANKNDPDYNNLDSLKEPLYTAILSLMKSLESDGMVCRLVFWFDN